MNGVTDESIRRYVDKITAMDELRDSHHESLDDYADLRDITKRYKRALESIKENSDCKISSFIARQALEDKKC